MPPRPKTPPRNPAQNDQVEQYLNGKEFQWEFREGIGLEEFDEDRSLHNQARVGKPIDKGTVERYMACMSNGDIFPGIIAAESSKTQPLLVADGNHRFQAIKGLGRKELDGYVVVGAKPAAITMLTFEANTRHGLPTNEHDRLHQALYLMDNGISAEEAARRLGVKVSTLRAAANLAAVDRRADEAGLQRARWDKLPTSAKQRLGQISTNEGFAAMSKLTLDASLRMEDVARAVNDLNSLRSSPKQEQYVKALRTTFAENIQTGTSANSLKAPQGRQQRSARTALGMCLGQINALPRPEDIVERMTEDDRPEWIGRVDAAITSLTKIRDSLQA